MSLGRPDFALALEQHAAYCEALCACGVELTTLEPDVHHPDSTFVEDTAIVTRAQRDFDAAGHREPALALAWNAVSDDISYLSC